MSTNRSRIILVCLALLGGLISLHSLNRGSSTLAQNELIEIEAGSTDLDPAIITAEMHLFLVDSRREPTAVGSYRIYKPIVIETGRTPTPGPSPTPTATASPTPSSGSVVFVGAGDIVDCGRVQDEQTAQLLDIIPGTVFTVGDNAYPGGSASAFNNCYEPTWGRHKARTRPAVGDNEYSTSGASGYFNYFGPAAGNPNEGYYSYNLGSWHIVVLNSNCSQVGGCDPDSPQGQWLQADLAANPSACILAIHHEPLFSSNDGDEDLRDFWVPLYQAGAEIVLSGHRHMYERFARQNPDGEADPGRGIRQFVVGTGGASLSSLDDVAANSEVRNDDTHGVLKFTLHPTSYDWEFIPITGQTFTDSGSESCVIP